MLENIKMLLGIQPDDTSKDVVINYWIDFYTKMVLDYCHLDALNPNLNTLIEQMVIEQMGGVGSAGNQSSEQSDISKGVKSITRGDYRIEYKDGINEKIQSTLLNNIALKYQGQLNLYRRFSC